MQTTVIGIYAGPSCGKSTLAAEVFVELKKQGKSVELVTEHAKKWAWLGHPIKSWEDSLYIFAKQLRAESIVYGKVEYLVTDSPLGLTVAYERFYDPLNHTVEELYHSVRVRQANENQVRALDFHLMRQHDYKTEGRFETEEQARKVDNIIRNVILGGFQVKNCKDVLEVLAHHKRDTGAKV